MSPGPQYTDGINKFNAKYFCYPGRQVSAAISAVLTCNTETDRYILKNLVCMVDISVVAVTREILSKHVIPFEPDGYPILTCPGNPLPANSQNCNKLIFRRILSS